MKRKDTIKKVKDRIQSLLHTIAVVRYQDCEAKGLDRICGGSLDADHIESRGFANTYGDMENIILLCHHHHFYWKKQHPFRWAELVKRKRDPDILTRLRERARRNIKSWGLRDWQRVEERLKAELSELSTATETRL